MNYYNPLRRYSIQKKISVGGTASVFLADDLALGKEVALKIMHPYLLNRPDAVERFAIEAKAAASLSHLNIISVSNHGEICNRPFLVMEYIDGMNLQELLDTYGPLPNLVTISIARQIVSGLICAHKNGIIHRDIKPANILLNKQGLVRITDLGIAYLADVEAATLTRSFIGSPYFISPEQAADIKVTGASDIFSLGILLYFCLSGELPFTGNTPQSVINAIINNKPADLGEKNPLILRWFAKLVQQCLKKSPSERPSAEEVLKIIDQQCHNATLKFDSSMIVDFQSAPEKYRAQEIKELFNLYKKSASADFLCGKVITGIRKKEQAHLLEHTQYIPLKKKVFSFYHILTGTLVVIMCSFFLFFLFFQ